MVEVGAIQVERQISRNIPAAVWSEGGAHKERFANAPKDGLDLTACRVQARIPFFTICRTIFRTLVSFHLR
jgi:hypothetical protein